jgi:hypothetical protein
MTPQRLELGLYTEEAVEEAARFMRPLLGG